MPSPSSATPPPPGRLAHRLVLGTVQLGAAYGRTRHQGVMSEREAFAILDRAWELGIRAFDTAEAYGDAIPRIADWVRRLGVAGQARVVTKARVDRPDMLATRIDAATRAFADIGELSLLTHGAASDATWEAFCKVAAVGPVLGQSVYTAAEVTQALAAPGVALLQAPGNVLDVSTVLARGDAAVRLDVRSVYLQGLLLESPHLAERRVAGASWVVAAVHSAASQVAPAPLAGLLVAAVLDALGPDDRVVVGVDTADQLTALTAAAHDMDPTMVARFRALLAGMVLDVDPRMLDPRRWVTPA